MKIVDLKTDNRKDNNNAVSYTHLDVYKRQVYGNTYRTQGEKDQYDRKLSCQRQKQCFSLFHR